MLGVLQREPAIVTRARLVVGEDLVGVVDLVELEFRAAATGIRMGDLGEPPVGNLDFVRVGRRRNSQGTIKALRIAMSHATALS